LEKLDQDKIRAGKEVATLHTGKLVPVYPETAGLSSKYLRSLINKVFPLVKTHLCEYLPDHLKKDYLGYKESLQYIHFPKNAEQMQQARTRLSFDEIFLIQLATQKIRYLWSKKSVVKPWSIKETWMGEFIQNLPFVLTDAQKRVAKEIVNDLTKKHPMNRLLQGEVGSGKTVVAALLVYLAKKNNLETLIMAPTEILAWQHFETLNKLLEPHKIKVGLYTGSRKYTKKVEKPRCGCGYTCFTFGSNPTKKSWSCYH
jgi:ATP-dependent DNA helicase RecG